MHPRNPYRTPPDFIVLAEAYPELRQFLKQTSTGTTIDYQDQAALRCLTKTLLHRDFGILITLPEDRLCPPVPNRLNYILWLQDIVSATDISTSRNKDVRGIDIGTGASAIYPLLGCAVNPRWHFYATEIDQKSVACARQNIDANGLGDRINVSQTQEGESVFPAAVLKTDSQLDFTMCNPPFYSDRKEVLTSAETKELGPNAVCTGADTEMITPGGEVAFVRQMVLESVQWREGCRWFTSMVGKMSSLSEIVELLKSNKIENYGITEFVQGRTRRWAIAWSFGDMHLPDVLARIANPALQSMMPLRNTLRQPFNSFRSRVDLESSLSAVLHTIDGVSTERGGKDIQKGTLVQAAQNTWSRAARRRKLAGTTASAEPSQTPALRCQLRCIEIETNERNSGRCNNLLLEFNWVEGKDRGLFESFMSHVSKKLETVAKASDVEMTE